MSRGYFITLEGVEGVGKSTHLEFVRQLLIDKGLSLIVTREPGGTPVAEAIRRVLLAHHEEQMTAEAEVLLLFAGRAQHIYSVIKPALENGQTVLCDRFTDATYAYQGDGRGVDKELIASLEKWINQQLIPDLTLLLDAPVKLALGRIKDRSADRFEVEDIEFFQRIRQGYLARAALYPKRFRVIDAGASIEAVQQQIASAIDSFFKERL